MIATFIQATLVAAAMLLLVRLGRSWSPALREALVAVALVKFLVPSTLIGGGVFSLLLSVADTPAAQASGRAAAAGAAGTPLLSGLIAVEVAGALAVLAAVAHGWLDCRRLLRSSVRVESAQGRSPRRPRRG